MQADEDATTSATVDKNVGQLQKNCAGTISSSLQFANDWIWLFFSLCQVHVAKSAGGARMETPEPNKVTADERLIEIGYLLALGLMRLRARQSSPKSPHGGESSLDCAARQSGPADVLKSGGSI
jgi:hypothetical protein